MSLPEWVAELECKPKSFWTLLAKVPIFLGGLDFQQLSFFTFSDQLSHELLNCPRNGHPNNCISQIALQTESNTVILCETTVLVLGVENVAPRFRQITKSQRIRLQGNALKTIIHRLWFGRHQRSLQCMEVVLMNLRLHILLKYWNAGFQQVSTDGNLERNSLCWY